MSNKKRNLKRKTQDLHIRVSEKEKEMLSKEAAKVGLSVSEYIRPLIMEKRRDMGPLGKENKVVVLCQDIVTYVQEKYGCEDDAELEERIDKIWSAL